MSDEQTTTVPVVLMLQCTERDMQQLDNPYAEQIFGVRPFVVNLTRDNFDFWWTAPLEEQNLIRLLLLERNLSANEASEWVQGEDFDPFVAVLIFDELTRRMQERWPGAEFTPEWREAVRLVVFGTTTLVDSPYVRRVFDKGMFPNAVYMSPSGQVLSHPVPPAPGGGSWDDILIEELELGVRPYNRLHRAGVRTVGDLISRSERDLMAIPDFGKKSLDEVVEELAQRHLRLRED